ncbi:MAG: GNAT family N-acetyltransferase [Allomuricauda sp.]|nr:MAG: GNAT family N-acetyltransferase [Allomuricauda sp.]
MKVEVVPYTPAYRKAFKSLNEWWVEKYFRMEAMDHYYLDHPQENIIDPGGYIAIALLNGEPAGACALVKMKSGPYDYELAKMGVSPQAHGKGVGFLLGQHIIAKAKELGATTIFLESNTILEPAIRLYRKLGFQEIEAIETPYDRCNIQMLLPLDC